MNSRVTEFLSVVAHPTCVACIAQEQKCVWVVLWTHAASVYFNHKCKRHLALYGRHPKHADKTFIPTLTNIMSFV